MQDTITIRETFANRDDAEEARERLEDGGFARNSMNIMRIGDQYELAIHTRRENWQRVQECLSPGYIFEARRYGREISEYAPSPGQSAWLFGVIAAIGAGLYYAYTRRRDLYAETYPARDGLPVRPLYEADQEPTTIRHGKPDCDLPENSKENLDEKLDHALEETFPTSDPVSVSITR